MKSNLKKRESCSNPFLTLTKNCVISLLCGIALFFPLSYIFESVEKSEKYYSFSIFIIYLLISLASAFLSRKTTSTVIANASSTAGILFAAITLLSFAFSRSVKMNIIPMIICVFIGAFLGAVLGKKSLSKRRSYSHK